MQLDKTRYEYQNLYAGARNLRRSAVPDLPEPRPDWSENRDLTQVWCSIGKVFNLSNHRHAMNLKWLIRNLEAVLEKAESEAPVEIEDDVAPVEVQQDDVASMDVQRDDVVLMEVQPEVLEIEDSEPETPQANAKGEMVNRAASRSATFTFKRLYRPPSAR